MYRMSHSKDSSDDNEDESVALPVGVWRCVSFRGKCRRRFLTDRSEAVEKMLQPCKNPEGKRRCRIDEIVWNLRRLTNLEFGNDLAVLIKEMRELWVHANIWKNESHFLDPALEPPSNPDRRAKKDTPIEQYRKAVHPDFCVRWGGVGKCDQRNVRKEKTETTEQVPPPCDNGAEGHFQCLKNGTQRAVKLLLNVEEPPMFGSFLVTYCNALQHWLEKFDPGFARFRTKGISKTPREPVLRPQGPTGKVPPPRLAPSNKFGSLPPGKVPPPRIRKPLGKGVTPKKREEYLRELKGSPDLMVVPHETIPPGWIREPPRPVKSRKTGKNPMSSVSLADRIRRRKLALNKLSRELQRLVERKGRQTDFTVEWVRTLLKRVNKWRDNERLFDPNEENEIDEESPFKELWHPDNCVKWGSACSQRKRYRHGRTKTLVPRTCDSMTLDEGTKKWNSYLCLLDGAKKTLKLLDSRNPPALGPLFYYARKAAEKWLKRYTTTTTSTTSDEEEESDSESDVD